ncbi:MAG: histidinol-phosphate transaminase [Pseudomonadota bacterium]
MPLGPADLIRPEILALAAYHVPEATGMVKLDAMENPYALPDRLRHEIGELAARVPVNRYPDPGAADLKAVLRDAMGIPAGAEILLGNGSDEIIQFVALALARPGAVLMAPEPSFVMYRMVATFTGMDYVGVPLAQDFSLDVPAMLAAIERRRPAVIFLAYPNNPTGNLFDAAAVEAVLRAAPGLVVVDEAYHAFAGASFLPRLDRYPNLLVMRTLSKLGLAGLRLGFAAASADWITHLEKLRLPYNVNSLTQAIAARVLGEGAVLAHQAEAIVAERARLLAALQALPPVTAFPSAANFILFRIPGAQRVCERLKERRILVKNLHGSHPRLDNCLRVTVGTPEENRAFLDALKLSLS